MGHGVRILGIDPGSRICGYGVVECARPGAYRFVDCGTLEADERAPLEERLGVIARDLVDLIAEFGPSAVAVEDVFHGQNARSALALAHARGTVFAVAGMAGLRAYSYPPSLVKQTVTGRGRAPKEQVALMVQTLAGLQRPPSRTDASDALAVAITHVLRGDLRVSVAAAPGARSTTGEVDL